MVMRWSGVYNKWVTETKNLNLLITALLSYKDPKELKSFLQAILTPKELEEIPTRLEIVKMIKKGIPQREIAQKLGVGVATVTRGSKEITKGNFRDIE